MQVEMQGYLEKMCPSFYHVSCFVPSMCAPSLLSSLWSWALWLPLCAGSVETRWVQPVFVLVWVVLKGHDCAVKGTHEAWPLINGSSSWPSCRWINICKIKHDRWSSLDHHGTCPYRSCGGYVKISFLCFCDS